MSVQGSIAFWQDSASFLMMSVTICLCEKKSDVFLNALTEIAIKFVTLGCSEITERHDLVLVDLPGKV